jgi:predicted methyltransferase
MTTTTKKLTLVLAACAALLSALPVQADEALKAAIASPHRTPANVARDGARHPYETLSFFGIKPTQTAGTRKSWRPICATRAS